MKHAWGHSGTHSLEVLEVGGVGGGGGGGGGGGHSGYKAIPHHANRTAHDIQ